MTNREREILNLIKENPMISQRDIADKLGIQRSSVAAHISNLTKKGLIKGKGYIISEGEYVVVIGGAGVDLIGFPTGKLILEDSNPGTLKTSMGGVGRNIAENMARLGVSVKMLTAIGDDAYGHSIKNYCENVGMDFSYALTTKESSTASYVCIMDEEGDMKVALSNMEIVEKIDIDYINKNAKLIKGAKVIVIDTNLSKEVIDYIANNFYEKPLFVDTVSTVKSEKIASCVGKFHTIKPNKIEAEILSGIKISSDEDLIRAKDWFIEKGVENIFISLGKDGVFYGSKEKSGFMKITPEKMVNATGAGDAFMAGLVYSHVNDFEIEKTVKFSNAMAALAVISEETINPSISVEAVLRKMK